MDLHLCISKRSAGFTERLSVMSLNIPILYFYSTLSLNRLNRVLVLNDLCCRILSIFCRS